MHNIYAGPLAATSLCEAYYGDLEILLSLLSL